jgi:60Kd inner membrane protein
MGPIQPTEPIGSFRDGRFSFIVLMYSRCGFELQYSALTMFVSHSTRIDGAPPLGWVDTLSFLALPIFLVISQVISMNLMQPKDPAARQDNVVLKILPVMIGWFALNVPAALTIYWVVNNIVTTGTTLAIRNSMEMNPVAVSSGSAAATAEPTASSIFAPPPPKPAGFAAPFEPAARVIDASGVKPLTSGSSVPAIVDAVIEDDEGEEVEAGTGMESESSGSKKVS